MTSLLLNWILASTLLIAFVILLRATFGKHISTWLQYALWAVVLVRLLVPTQLFTAPIETSQVFPMVRTVRTIPNIIPERENRPIQNTEDTEAALPVQTMPASPAPGNGVPVPSAPEARKTLNPLTLLGGVWLAGTAVAMLALLWSNLSFARRLRRVRVPLAARASLAETGCPLQVYITDGLPSPCLFGIIRPAVYLTPEAAADPTMLRHVLVHETTHFRHGDHIWSALRCVALAIHWWNPLVWLATVLSRQDAELACDEGALKRLGDHERSAYGGTLLTLVTSEPQPSDLLCCATTMTGAKRSLRERVRRIAHTPKRWFWATLLTVVLSASMSVCAFAKTTQTLTVLQYHTEPISLGAVGREQESWSSLYDGSDSSSWASAWLRSEDGAALPAGSLGIESRLYNDDGELCASTGMRYNTSEASFVAGVTSASSDGYCSWGHIRTTEFEEEGFTVGNAYRLTSGDDFVFSSELGNYKFPEKLLEMLKENENGYPENSMGETYGSALLKDYNRKYWVSPVLLSAVGTDGVHGYVREADLNPYVATRQDAVAYMSKLEENRVLPLYDKEGNVIGTFVLDGSFISGTTATELESAKVAAAAKPGAETRQSVKLPETEAEFAALVKRSEANCPYQRTSKGETYSSGPDISSGEVGYDPVWIPVVSTEDEDGFMRSKDFLNGPGTYPVYDMEGNVIGEFVIKESKPPVGYDPNMSMDEVKALVREG